MTVVVDEMDVAVESPEREQRGERPAAPKAPDEQKLIELLAYEQWKQTERFRIWRSDGSMTVGEVERPVQRTYWRTRMRYLVTNAGPKPVTVDLRQGGLSWDTRVVAESLPSRTSSSAASAANTST